MRLFLRLLATAILAFAAGAFVLLRENPEASFWAAVRDRQEQELASLRARHPGQPVILFAGGSSCAFSVDPAFVSAEAGRPACNLGTSAWSGPKFYLHQAFKCARRGDLLVLAIEPNFLTEPGLLEPTSLGLALAWGRGDPDGAVGGSSFGESIGLRQQIELSRPGARYLVTWLGKKITRGEPYYYSAADLRPGGRLETRRGHPTGRGDERLHPGELTPEASAMLERAAWFAGQQGIRVVYALPWYFTAGDSAAANRGVRRVLLEQVARIMPVLEDPALGIQTDPSLFSDTNFHLTAAGSERRSRELGRGVAGLLAE
jgi:hypothetical protein